MKNIELLEREFNPPTDDAYANGYEAGIRRAILLLKGNLR